MYQIIEKYFWAFLLAGVTLGLIFPIDSKSLMVYLKPALMVMLFIVFLKADILQVFKRMKNYKQVTFLVIMYLLVFPIFFFFIIKPFSLEIALGVLLLSAMPAGAASPVLTDILDGNTELSASIAITTSIVTPFSVPLLFSLLNVENIEIDSIGILLDLATFIFIPMIASQIVKKILKEKVEATKHIFSSFNVFILAFSIYLIMGAQRDMILSYSILDVLTDVLVLYAVFILLHIFGYLLGFNEDSKGKIATAVGAAYMNNGLAIVLAAIYFTPGILLITVLAEIPWNTLLGLFKKVLSLKEKKSKSIDVKRRAFQNG